MKIFCAINQNKVKILKIKRSAAAFSRKLHFFPLSYFP